MKTLAVATLLLVSLSLAGCDCSPDSPRSSKPGDSPEFDSLLSDAEGKWSFVFGDDFRIILVDAFGNDEAVLLNLRKATGNQNAEFIGRKSISPDGRFIPAAYYARMPGGAEPDAHLVLLDLNDPSVRHVPHKHEDFRLGWYYNTHWLDHTTFLVPLNKFTARGGGGSAESVRYLRKQVGHLDADAVIAFPTEDPVRIWHSQTSALLFASEHEPMNSWTVHAVDLRGTRQATSAESAYFNRKYQDTTYDPLCPVSVRTQRVMGNAVEGWGRYWEENRHRYWILLDGRRVRCSDGQIERAPVWDEDLKLLTWYEIGTPYQVFYMDAQGHYRKWRSGHYWGKIPKRKPASNESVQAGK